MLSNNSRLNGMLAIVIASLLWGTTGTAASFTPDVSPLATGAFSMGVGGLLLVISSWKDLESDKLLLFKSPKVLITGSLSVAVYPLAFYTSMKLSGVAIGTVVSIASAPFFAIVLERLIDKKPISMKWMVSFLFGVIGIVLLIIGKQPESTHSAQSHTETLGLVLGLVAGFTYATYAWAARQMIERGVSSKSSMASMFGFAALLLLPSLLITGEQIFATSTNFFVAVYMAAIPIFFGYLCFSYGLRYIDAGEATLLTLLEPAIAALFAVIIVGEKFLAIGWLGMGFIGICLLIQTADSNKLSARLKLLNPMFER